VRRAQQLGRYHLLDRIAFGGMAEIYRAKTFDAHGHAHLVAVKRVLAHLAEDEDFIQMLVDEAKIASQLKNPNIARVFEFARAHGEYFIAMEHVDGKDLRTILERCRQKKKPMPAQHAAYVGSELAAALHAAHTANDSHGRPLRIVHRDVSPSNVIASYTGEVKLCDFGIAKATLSRVHTKTGVIKGKVKYMSPEQALGRKLDHRSDVFSLGSCLYEMLTRMPPFTASNEMDLLIKVRDAKYRPISEVIPTVPRPIEAIADRCLARSRAHRYQSAEEVMLALREFLSDYMAEYSRSHLGRYVRKMFATEIERELRMLEEYVVSEVVDEDLGENLIGDVLGPHAEFTKFSPKPSGEGADDRSTNYDTLAEGSSQVKTANRVELGEGRPGIESESQKRAQIKRRLVGAGAPPGQPPPAAASHPPMDADAAPTNEEGYDLSIHDAPTQILEHRRKRRKKS
jgi:serine/threonine-protein kinase